MSNIKWLCCLLLFVSIDVQTQAGKDYMISLFGAYDIAASNNSELVDSGFFNYSITGFYMIGIEGGYLVGQHNFSLSLSKGDASLYESIEEPGVEPLNHEIELQEALYIAINYRKQYSRIKPIDKVVVNFGNRLSAMFNNYEGVKAYRQNDPNGGPPTYKFDDFSMNTIGLEAGAYAEIGRKVPGKMGIFLNVELLYTL